MIEASNDKLEKNGEIYKTNENQSFLQKDLKKCSESRKVT